ncbi:MAG: hypothetical protein JWN73_2667 [Betaproteobacteria bacterium]|nr:hypothetical protein [Betaproteobacteria bacterium]
MFAAKIKKLRELTGQLTEARRELQRCTEALDKAMREADEHTPAPELRHRAEESEAAYLIALARFQEAQEGLRSLAPWLFPRR